MRGALVMVTAAVASACGGGGGGDGGSVDAPATDASSVDALDSDAASSDSGTDSASLDGAGGGDAGTDAPPAVCPTPPNPPGTSAVIGAAGGTVALGSAARIVIPAGALAVDTTVTLRPLPLELAHTERALTAAYELGPQSLAFSIPATLTVDLGALPPQPDEIALRVGPATGPFSTATTTRSGTAYSAAVNGATLGFGARSVAAPAPTATCTATATPAETTYLFQNSTGGSQYFTAYARPTATGLAATATHQQDALWNVFSYAYAADGTSTGTVNLTGNIIHSIFGGHVAPSGNDVLVAYDSNQTQGSEVWVARRTASGSAIGAPVRISEDPTLLSVRPQIVALPGGGAFVVWLARHPTQSILYLRAAVLDASLALVRRFDVTPSTGITHAPSDFALVVSAQGVGLVWTWSQTLEHGVRYQAFTHDGCPMTDVIDVATGYIVSAHVTATVAGDHVIVATSGNTVPGDPRVARLRAIHLTTGLLGATRRFDDTAMIHVGIAAHAGGFHIAGKASGVIYGSLGPELDRRSPLTSISDPTATSAAVSVAASATGDAGLVTWVDYPNVSTARGRVRVVACTP